MLCSDCGGSGNHVRFTPKLNWLTCPVCQGSGVVASNQRPEGWTTEDEESLQDYFQHGENHIE